MMIRISLLLAACTTTLLVSSCSLFDDKDGALRNRGKDYLRASPIEPITLPEGMTSGPIEQLYPIQNVNATDEFGDAYKLLDFDVPRPDSINADETNSGIKIQSLAGARWVFLGASTSQVWPRTQSYLTSADVAVVSSDASQGLIETDWLQFKDNDEVMARFQIRLEKGIHPDTTEVHVLEAELPFGSEPPVPMVWPKTSTDPEREEWMVRSLANHLAETIDNASASLLGQDVGGEVKASYVRGASEPTLALNLNPSRSWASIAHAATKEGYTRWASDEQRGLIYVSYDEALVKKKGFWGKLFTLDYGSGDKAKPAPYTLDEVLGHLSGSLGARELFSSIKGAEFNDALKDGDGYLLVVRPAANGYTVIIRDHRGRILPVREAKKRIRLLRNNLI